MERKTMRILDVQTAKGSEHDFKVYEDAIGTALSGSIAIDADSGCQALRNLHPNSRIVIKASKNHRLSEWEQAYSRRLARRRIVIEHIQRENKDVQDNGASIPEPLPEVSPEDAPYLWYHQS